MVVGVGPATRKIGMKASQEDGSVCVCVCVFLGGSGRAGKNVQMGFAGLGVRLGRVARAKTYAGHFALVVQP